MKYYPEKGSRWSEWESLLPDRTQGAISSRATKLGLACVRTHTTKSERKRRKRNGRYKPVEDPYEKFVLARMKEGLTPSEIDRSMKWYPGKTRLIITNRWERLKNAT